MTELPTSFGKYFLTEKLATGGMAEIYLAKIVGPGGFEKLLVIKQIHPRLTGQRHFVDLFVAEAKTLVTLAHGNIVPVYELGVVDDHYFIAMEYIDGPTLYRLTETLAKRGARMAPPVAAWIAARILEGLDYAHRKGEGVIHRDLSPRNVMLSRDGEVKIVDFGIAVTHGTLGESTDDAAPPTGSFPYMSPEQVRREPLAGTSDLFSLGVLLWEMLVGERLFARPDAQATLAAVCEAPIPRPSERRPEIPPRLDDVTMRALERDVTARYQSAAEMLAALQKYLYTLDDTPGPRDVATLVARYCPPESRRLPTHSEVIVPGSAAIDERPSDAIAGPATAVVPRGRTRARTETFATHVALDELLGKTTPAPPPEPARAPLAIPVPGREPPGRGVLLAIALGTIALGVVAVVLFLRTPASVLADPDAGIDSAPSLDAAPLADALPADAPLDAAPVDAPLRDASVVRPRPDALAAVPGDATLRVGADPWGEIFVDGAPRGRTPTTLVLPAGKHVVVVRYGGVDPPLEKAFTLDLAVGETESIHADFH